jgi:acyl carrier protein
MTSAELTEKSYDVISATLSGIDSSHLSLESNLFGQGLDSVQAMNLILNLQTAFEVQFDGSDISLENFQTPGQIIELLKRKKGL